MFSTTDTFGSLIDEVVLALQGYTAALDLSLSLSGDITDSATTITVDTADVVNKGLIEIGSELIYVSAVSGATLTVPAWGRGYKGTTAAAHLSGSQVVLSPTWPRSIVGREVNNAIRGVYPWLFGVDTTSFTANIIGWANPLPADAELVLAVEVEDTGTGDWDPVRAYEVIHSGDLTTYPSGVGVNIPYASPPDGTTRVVYSKVPTQLTAEADLFSATGLPTSSKDVIVLGAAARLTPWLDAARLPTQSVEADALDSPRPIGSALNVAKDIRSQYMQRLLMERSALLIKYKIPVHSIG